ncbi:MAG: hypothetical protein HY791_03870 [Deltaproteobacteria bacterium]|nr:hypothetical protein [Deltaproteobacteria bacterium]
MTDEATKKPRGLSRPVEVVRQDLLADKDTVEMAKVLGLTPEEFVEKVIGYAQNPEKEPELLVIDEEEAEEEGLDIPSTADVQRWLRDVEEGKVQVGPVKLHQSDGFTTDRPEVEVARATGNPADLQAPPVEAPRSQIVVEDTAMGSVLRQQLQNQQRKTALGAKLPQPSKPSKR